MDNKRIVSRSNWILFSKKDIKWLFAYYMVLFILSLIATGLIFWFYTDIVDIFQVSKLIVICSVPCALLGSCSYYIRKIYKVCIQGAVNEPATDFKSSIRVLGAKAYFFIRPFVSVALALIISFGIYFGIFTLTVTPEIVQGNFAVLCMILSFYIGFNNGVILKDLDDKENKFLKSFFRRNSDEQNGQWQ